MNSEVYAVEAEVASFHWWFAGRRRLFSRLIAGLRPDRAWRVVEVGAGTGANLAALTGFASRLVVACDVSVDALRRLQNRAALTRADATSLPFMSDSICCWPRMSSSTSTTMVMRFESLRVCCVQEGI